MVDAKIRAYDTTDTFETLDSYYQSAFELMKSALAKKAFDVGQEPDAIRNRYGRTSMGQGCLLVRRLVEAGVRFVTVSRGDNAWDHHGNIFPPLAIVSGEFGRTAEINVNAGWDHWPNCYSLVLAGGGVPGGLVWGASDMDGMYVKEKPVEIPDLAATIFHKLGIDTGKEYVSIFVVDQAASRLRTFFAISLPAVRWATRRSYSDCRFSHTSGVTPK